MSADTRLDVDALSEKVIDQLAARSLEGRMDLARTQAEDGYVGLIRKVVEATVEAQERP